MLIRPQQVNYWISSFPVVASKKHVKQNTLHCTDYWLCRRAIKYLRLSIYDIASTNPIVQLGRTHTPKGERRKDYRTKTRLEG